MVDCNLQAVTEAEWDWADLVIISAMIVQKTDFIHQIQEAKCRGKKVAVGGPYVTSVPAVAETAGADFLVLDEGEITLPLLVEAIAQGKTSGIFRAEGERPDVSASPIPRYDLLNLNDYSEMSVQFSRGCPFQCEFCDIIVLYGRKPRTKTPAQLLAELQTLYDLGWRRSIFIVDDNFIGNKRNVKLLLRELSPWMMAHRYPFWFNTEASIDLAQDQELLNLMIAANFKSVFIGIETPDIDTLALTQKFQNTRDSLIESVQTINQSGLSVMAGFILGFDGEKAGAGQRIIDFVEATAIPKAMFGLLQALPNTALWHRLEKEGRLIESAAAQKGHQMTLMNFLPSRPITELIQEYLNCFWELYEPSRYLARVYRHFLRLKPTHHRVPLRMLEWVEVRAVLTIFWRQGMKRSTRWQFWRQLVGILWHDRSLFVPYLSNCALLEHFLDYRQIVRDQLKLQVQELRASDPQLPVEQEAAA